MVVTYLTRQREAAIALFDNYDKALKLENSALNSNGKAMEKYAVYQDSIAAKQDRITALAQTWVQNMNFEEVIGGLFSVAEAFMKVFSDESIVSITKATIAVLAFVKAAKSFVQIMQIATAAGGIAKFQDIFAAISLTGLSAAPAILGVVAAITVLVVVIGKLHKSASELRSELQGLETEVSEAEGKIDSYKENIDANNESIKDLQSTINKGAGGLVEQSEIERLKEENKQIERQIALEEERLEIIKAQQRQTAQELAGKKFGVARYSVGYSRSSASASKQVMSRGKAWVSSEEVIAEYQSEIANLEKEWQEAVDKGNVELADAISAKKTELEDELANTVIPQLELLRDYYPEIATVLDAYYDSLLSFEEKFATASEKLTPEAQVNLANLANAIKQQDDLNKEMEEYGSQVDLNNRKMLETSRIDSEIAKEMGEGYATLFSRTYTEQDFGGNGTGAILVTPILPNGEVFENWETLESYLESLMVDGKIDVSKDTEGVIMGVFDEGDIEASIAKADEFGNAAHEANAAVDELAQTLGLEGFTGTLDSLYDALENTKDEGLRAFIDELKAGNFTIQQIVQQMVQLQNATESEGIKLETAASQITKFKDKVSAVVVAEEELTSTGYVSADAAEKLAEVFGDDVYDAMVWSEKGYKISKASLEELIEKQKEEYYLALNKAQDAAQAVVSANVDETASYKEKTVAILEALNAKKKELQLAMTSEVSGTSSYIQGRIISRKYAAQLSELEGIEDELLTAQKNLDTLDSTLSYLRRSSASTSSSSSSKSDAETAYERQNRLLEQALYLSQQIAEVYKDTDEAKYREEINKQLKIYNRLMDEAHKEAERYRKLGYTDESKEIQELQKAWWGYYNDRKDLQDGLSDWEKQNAEDTKQAVEDALSEVKDAIDDLLDDAEDALNDKLDALEARIKKNEAIRDLYEAFFGVLNDVADGMHEIDKELQASMDSADYLDEKLRQAMYNEDDYKKMSSKLNQIAEESRAMFEDYLSQLEMLTEDEIYKADYITNEFNRQYEYKKLEYDIAEKELELAKAQTKLQNTLMNRNVRMYKNGEWIWTADHSAVEEAKKEVADAEYEYRNAEIKRKQQEIIDKYEGIIDDLGLQKDAAEAEFDALKDMWENIQKQLTTEEDAMTRLLKAINGTDIPEFKSIINNVGGALETLIYNLTGIGSSFGGYGGGTGGFSYGGGTGATGGTGSGSGSYDAGTAGGSASGWVLADGSKANLSFKDTTPYGKGTSASIKGADMSRDMKWAGQTVQKNGWAITYDEDGYAKSAINVRVGAAGENLANKYPRVDADGNLMYNPNDNSTLTGREYYYSTKSDVDDSRTWDKSNPNYTGGSSSSKDKDGSYTATSSSGSNYTIGSEKGKNFVESAKAGSTMTGGDGSKWTKNSDGSTTIEKNGKTYTVHDGGGILRGMGGIKATTADEAIFPPSITSKLLSPQKSREFLDSANAITKMLDNSSAISAMTSRFAGVVSGKSATTNDSHDLYLNGNPLGSMTKADSMALATILRRYIPVNGGGR